MLGAKSKLAFRAVLVAASCGWATTALKAEPNQPVVDGSAPPPHFVSLPYKLDSGGIKLAGGQEVDPQDWQTVAVSEGTLTCTASLVGKQVVLTSAHCLDARPWEPSFSLALATVQFGGSPIKMSECLVHPDYHAAGPNGSFPRNGNDIAFCRLEAPVTTVGAFESVIPASLDIGTPVVLLGYGCKSFIMGPGKPRAVPDPPGKRILRIGEQTIDASREAVGDSGALLARSSSDGTKPSLCPGDSGGPVLIGTSEKTVSTNRRIGGLNSAFWPDWSLNGPPVLKSYYAQIGPSFAASVRSWADSRALVVCGVNRQPPLGGCR